MSNIKTLEIKITDAKDRKLLFTRICELLSVDIDKEVKKLKIKSTAAGLTVNRDHLIDFVFAKKLSGTLDFEKRTLEVDCPVIESKGLIAVTAPETIKKTSVDEVKKEAPKDPLGAFTSTKEEDDDELF